jgi:hypothetical protein
MYRSKLGTWQVSFTALLLQFIGRNRARGNVSLHNHFIFIGAVEIARVATSRYIIMLLLRCIGRNRARGNVPLHNHVIVAIYRCG